MASNFTAERAKAKASGLKFFFCDKPCIRGHLAKRYVSSGNCHECRRSEEGRARRRELRPKYLENATPKAKARKEAWSAANKDRLLASAKKWYARNKEQHFQAVMRWRANNPEANAAIRHKRRALEVNAPGSHTRDDLAAILKAQKGKCAYCRIRLKRPYHVDHIIPLSRGGSNAPDNLQMTCPRCNFQKAAMMPWDFARKRGMLL